MKHAEKARRSATTFIGPVTVDKSGTRPGAFRFLILQPTSGIIKLEYPDKAMAKAARDQLLQSSHTHKVQSNKLVTAISEGFAEASEKPPEESNRSRR